MPGIRLSKKSVDDIAEAVLTKEKAEEKAHTTAFGRWFSRLPFLGKTALIFSSVWIFLFIMILTIPDFMGKNIEILNVIRSWIGIYKEIQ